MFNPVRALLLTALLFSGLAAAAPARAVVLVRAPELSGPQKIRLLEAGRATLEGRTSFQVEKVEPTPPSSGPVEAPCRTDGCLLDTARAAGAELALVLDAGLPDLEFELRASFVDVETGRVASRMARGGSPDLPEASVALLLDAVLPAWARKGLASVSVTAPADAVVKVDGRKVGVAPLPGPLALAAGAHEIDVMFASGQGLLWSRKLVEGERLHLEATPHPAIEGVKLTRSSESVLRPISYALWTAGAAAIAASLVVGGVVRATGDDLAACTEHSARLQQAGRGAGHPPTGGRQRARRERPAHRRIGVECLWGRGVRVRPGGGWPMSVRLLVAAYLFAATASCYEAPPLRGPYRCNDDQSCGDNGFVCDDGVCCHPTGEPLCRSYVLDGGTCANGSIPKPYYADFDRDGYGNDNEIHYYCAPPIEDHFVERGGDCNDTPGESGEDVHPGALIHPGAHEQCDFQDNDCDGEIDEGLEKTAYYPDLDGDGYGAESADPVMYCGPPANMVRNNRDCNDGDKLQNPGAVEVCNGRDDDCDGIVDEDTEAGAACDVPGKMGICGRGTVVCTESGPVCMPTVAPERLDVCDGTDNDCDGQTDEKPDCAGPLSLSAERDVTFGAKRLNLTLNGSSNSCVSGNPGVSVSFDGRHWASSGSASHVAWVQRRDGAYWDLTRANTRMKIKFSWTLTNAASEPWAAHFQPVVFLCGKNGFIRLVHGTGSLMTQPTGSLDVIIPVRGDPSTTDSPTGWGVGQGSSDDVDAVLKQVERIELLIQPNYNGATQPAFDINVQAWGFP